MRVFSIVRSSVGRPADRPSGGLSPMGSSRRRRNLPCTRNFLVESASLHTWRLLSSADRKHPSTWVQGTADTPRSHRENPAAAHGRAQQPGDSTAVHARCTPARPHACIASVPCTQLWARSQWTHGDVKHKSPCGIPRRRHWLRPERLSLPEQRCDIKQSAKIQMAPSASFSL